MLVTVLDSAGVTQTMIAKGQEAVVDHSGTISSTGVAQVLVAANSLRSGWVMQNVSNNPMYVNELGTATAGAGSFKVAPGEVFPREGFPVSTGAVSIIGTAGDGFTCRTW